MTTIVGKNAYLVRTNTKLKSVKNTRKKPHSTTRKMYKRPVYKFKINDRVRISRLKTPFLREASEKWTGEIFIISHRYLRDNIPVYKLKEFDQTPLLGTYYTQELQKVNISSSKVFKVSSILSKRKVNGKLRCSFLGKTGLRNIIVGYQSMT